ncbi:hypothetical protein [Pseudoxanthomonas wuyuanensis]|uniref:hypothetical protein n=1 Tax=Pseudoxanthomonas wuyuanensis TaxID=1073196 RepID=UPI000BE394A1|nr:hypothetical protein [Pseudoxanthomonas wuyuanensis]
MLETFGGPPTAKLVVLQEEFRLRGPERAVRSIKQGKPPDLDAGQEYRGEFGLQVPSPIPDGCLPDMRTRLTRYFNAAKGPLTALNRAGSEPAQGGAVFCLQPRTRGRRMPAGQDRPMFS